MLTCFSRQGWGRWRWRRCGRPLNPPPRHPRAGPSWWPTRWISGWGSSRSPWRRSPRRCGGTAASRAAWCHDNPPRRGRGPRTQPSNLLFNGILNKEIIVTCSSSWSFSFSSSLLLLSGVSRGITLGTFADLDIWRHWKDRRYWRVQVTKSYHIEHRITYHRYHRIRGFLRITYKKNIVYENVNYHITIHLQLQEII